MRSSCWRTAILVALLTLATAACGTFNCAASSDSNRSAGACGAHTTFLR